MADLLVKDNIEQGRIKRGSGSMMRNHAKGSINKTLLALRDKKWLTIWEICNRTGYSRQRVEYHLIRRPRATPNKQTLIDQEFVRTRTIIRIPRGKSIVKIRKYKITEKGLKHLAKTSKSK